MLYAAVYVCVAFVLIIVVLGWLVWNTPSPLDYDGPEFDEECIEQLLAEQRISSGNRSR
jgi:hypothetical protein